MLNEQALKFALNNPQKALSELDKYRSEQSLMEFTARAWDVLEVGNPLIPNKCMYAICDHLEAVTRGEITRLLINVPPGMSKSMLVNVMWPAWEMGPMGLPYYRYISAAHKAEQAERDVEKGHRLATSEWYQEKWPMAFLKNASTKWENTSTGWRNACAAKGLTGLRGDRLLYDDPHSVRGADSDAERNAVLYIFAETAQSRLNKISESAIVVIMQRVHEYDVSGIILENLLGLGYEHLMLPMEFEEDRKCYSTVKPSYITDPTRVTVYYNRQDCVWREKPQSLEAGEEHIIQTRYPCDWRKTDGELLAPNRYDEDSLIVLKEGLSMMDGDYAVAGQLQQRPSPRGGGMVKKEDLKIIDRIPDGPNGEPLIGKWCRGWDLAATDKDNSPWTVGTDMFRAKDGRIFINNVARARKEPADLDMFMLEVVELDDEQVPNKLQSFPQDPGSAGKVQKKDISVLLGAYNVKCTTESGSKELRFRPFASQCGLGNVYLVKGSWNAEFIKELTTFPASKFKDQADATSRAYSELMPKKRKNRGGRGGKVVTLD